MIKSQDELNKCNDGKRSSEVLIKTIEKCERLEQIIKHFLDFNEECALSLESTIALLKWLETIIAPHQKETVSKMIKMNEGLLKEWKQIKELEK